MLKASLLFTVFAYGAPVFAQDTGWSDTGSGSSSDASFPVEPTPIPKARE